ncbi:hypothetical protein KBB48_02585 [Candidatus Shapirobacteria bacterium]|nr:hypothetical protein [Candidatus Shapirobacteria bacterium]
MRKTAIFIFACLWFFAGAMRVEAKEMSSEISIDTLRQIQEVKWQGWNGISWLVGEAVRKEVPANTIVLLLLLPLLATVVSGLHYLVGVSGYGIFMPTMMAVAFLATGTVSGLALFGVVLAITLLGNTLIKKLKLHFWPARTLTLLLVSLGTFGVMVISSYFKMIEVSKISIFPVLFMIMLTEEFVRTQLTKSKKEAIKLVIGTLILAVIGAMTMGIKEIQEKVLLYPEVVVLLVVVANMLVGSYGGIRFLEIKRFKKAIRKK